MELKDFIKNWEIGKTYTTQQIANETGLRFTEVSPILMEQYGISRNRILNPLFGISAGESKFIIHWTKEEIYTTMETPITKHRTIETTAFQFEQQKFIETVPTNIVQADKLEWIRGAHDAGGEAAQAILQPEINRLREALQKIIRTHNNNLEEYIDQNVILIATRALELAEGPNK